MSHNLDYRQNILDELRKALASYFSLRSGEVRQLLSNLLLSLEAEGMILEKYASNREDPNYSFALESLVMVGKRLRSPFLQERSSSLTSAASDQDIRDAIDDFLKDIRDIRSLHAQQS